MRKLLSAFVLGNCVSSFIGCGVADIFEGFEKECIFILGLYKIEEDKSPEKVDFSALCKLHYQIFRVYMSGQEK